MLSYLIHAKDYQKYQYMRREVLTIVGNTRISTRPTKSIVRA